MAIHAAPRADPDALLAIASKEGRGRLKVFLGASPGVGKTFTMLTAAREAKAAGRDVVLGLVETHGRRETEALLTDFEILPRRSIAYRNHWVPEFDLDAALVRQPSLILVDEFAHTNVPGSRHPAKRWHDVRELLDAGIDVWTTLNVQHLESLNDVVLKITGVRVRETVPDTVFETADEVVLVDLPPGELLKRMAEGKVYVQDTAAQAVQRFFTPQNLTALRELALRRVAEQVDDALVERMQAGAIEGPWAAGERIMALVGPDVVSRIVVRQSKRLADLMNAPWTAISVERPGQRTRRGFSQAAGRGAALGGRSRRRYRDSCRRRHSGRGAALRPAQQCDANCRRPFARRPVGRTPAPFAAARAGAQCCRHRRACGDGRRRTVAVARAALAQADAARATGLSFVVGRHGRSGNAVGGAS